MARSPILPYAEFNPVTPYYETEVTTLILANESNVEITNESDVTLETDQ
jgi:hypothetical protein